ncbi:Protein HIT1 [Yarrowia sp. B02]|nr:Protein HIT1 [Yarrowia sp. B02]
MAQCAFCDQESKYTCPKCQSKYCSLVCFKKETHTAKHGVKEEDQKEQAPDQSEKEPDQSVTEKTETPNLSIYDPLVKDDVIQKLLSYKSTKTHLKHIATLLKDSKVSREATEEGRMEVANLGLLELRAGGENENEAIEDFCQRALALMEEKGI